MVIRMRRGFFIGLSAILRGSSEGYYNPGRGECANLRQWEEGNRDWGKRMHHRDRKDHRVFQYKV
jgi:hypothetical protein